MNGLCEVKLLFVHLTNSQLQVAVTVVTKRYSNSSYNNDRIKTTPVYLVNFSLHLYSKLLLAIFAESQAMQIEGYAGSGLGSTCCRCDFHLYI